MSKDVLRDILCSRGLSCYHSSLVTKYGSDIKFYAKILDFDRIVQICDEIASDSSLKRRKLERLLLRIRYSSSSSSSSAHTMSSYIPIFLSILITLAAALAATHLYGTTGNHPDKVSSMWQHYSLPHMISNPPPNDMNLTYIDEIRNRKYVVICAGSRRSGSTWQYHATRMILTLADPTRRLIQGAKSSEKVLEITSILESTPKSVHGHDIQPYVVLKVHEYREEWAKLATHVFTSHRDPRDVYYSVQRIQMEWEAKKSKGGEKFVQRICSKDSRLMKDASLCAMAVFRDNYLRWLSSSNVARDMRYESVFDDTENSILDEIQVMIDVLGFHNHVSAHAVKFAMEQMYRRRAESLRAQSTVLRDSENDMKVKVDVIWDTPGKNGKDQNEDMAKEYSYMHFRHVENPLHGQSRKHMSPVQIQVVEDVFKDWIRDGGY